MVVGPVRFAPEVVAVNGTRAEVEDCADLARFRYAGAAHGGSAAQAVRADLVADGTGWLVAEFRQPARTCRGG